MQTVKNLSFLSTNIKLKIPQKFHYTNEEHSKINTIHLDRHADIEEPNDESYTPLMEAAREGHKEVVELLLDRGANVNSKIEEGIETPLTLAASGGYL